MKRGMDGGLQEKRIGEGNGGSKRGMEGEREGSRKEEREGEGGGCKVWETKLETVSVDAIMKQLWPLSVTVIFSSSYNYYVLKIKTHNIAYSSYYLATNTIYMHASFHETIIISITLKSLDNSRCHYRTRLTRMSNVIVQLTYLVTNSTSYMLTVYIHIAPTHISRNSQVIAVYSSYKEQMY